MAYTSLFSILDIKKLIATKTIRSRRGLEIASRQGVWQGFNQVEKAVDQGGASMLSRTGSGALQGAVESEFWGGTGR